MKCSHCGGTGAEPPGNGLPRSIRSALDHCRLLGSVPRLRKPEFWTAEYRAAPDVCHDEELYKAEAWLQANPTRPKKDLGRFVHNWLARAQQREAENG